jgi:uncharacterized protein GlcG (DUF336 family)
LCSTEDDGILAIESNPKSFDRRAAAATSTADLAIEKAKSVMNEVELALDTAEVAQKQLKNAANMAREKIIHADEQNLLAIGGPDSTSGPNSKLTVSIVLPKSEPSEALELGLPDPNPPPWLKMLQQTDVQELRDARLQAISHARQSMKPVTIANLVPDKHIYRHAHRAHHHKFRQKKKADFVRLGGDKAGPIS